MNSKTHNNDARLVDSDGAIGWIHRLLQIGQASPEQSTSEFFERMLAHIVEGLYGSTGWLALPDAAGNFEIIASVGLTPSPLGQAVRPDDETIAHAAATDPFTLSGGPQSGEVITGDASCACGPSHIRSRCWPLRGEHGLIGLLNVGHAEAVRTRSRWGAAQELRALMSVISMVVQGALTIHGQERRIEEQARSSQALRESYQELKSAKEALERVQRQLLQQEKMASIGQLAAGVAHEINNPVGYISANFNSLKHYLAELDRLLDHYAEQETGLDDARRAATADLKQSICLDDIRLDITALLAETGEGLLRVRGIVKDLKDFAHPDEGEWVNADIHRSLDTTLNVANNELKYKAELIRDYGDIPWVECLPFQLNQVFMNLLVNAAHAIDERGIITLRTYEQDGEVCVEIGDTGHGMQAEQLDHIFDPFFTTKPPGKGTGLGLSVSYGIIQKHHGRIEVESTPGAGSVFRVWLPISQTVEPVEPAAT